MTYKLFSQSRKLNKRWGPNKSSEIRRFFKKKLRRGAEEEVGGGCLLGTQKYMSYKDDRGSFVVSVF